jgi:hypothetical protein
MDNRRKKIEFSFDVLSFLVLPFLFSMTSPTSTNPHDYEVLIRRWGETGYASYCPQLEYMIKGTAHVEVEDAMKQHILHHIASLGEAANTDAQV